MDTKSLYAILLILIALIIFLVMVIEVLKRLKSGGIGDISDFRIGFGNKSGNRGNFEVREISKEDLVADGNQIIVARPSDGKIDPFDNFDEIKQKIDSGVCLACGGRNVEIKENASDKEILCRDCGGKTSIGKSLSLESLESDFKDFNKENFEKLTCPICGSRSIKAKIRTQITNGKKKKEVEIECLSCGKITKEEKRP